ncbi:hypothetical protein A2U01_0003438 [Trifolium medium]|uniref:Uncharacterized protein n=1 Tax=Trifolium medium TaxID=97028 RepID=A0A392M5G0_9FABA|nr:hypothetical protein [Trifolium medium]
MEDPPPPPPPPPPALHPNRDPISPYYIHPNENHSHVICISVLGWYKLPMAGLV